MNELQGWVFTICGGTLVCGVVSALCPGKNYEKAIQLLLGLFLFCCFLTPVTMDWSLPSVDLEQAEQQRLEVAKRTEEEVTSQLQEDVEMRTRQETDRILSAYGLEAGEAGIVLETQEERLSVIVTVPHRLRDSSQAIRQELSQALGAQVTLEFAQPEERNW